MASYSGTEFNSNEHQRIVLKIMSQVVAMKTIIMTIMIITMTATTTAMIVNPRDQCMAFTIRLQIK
jgi:hypothetical protein